MPNQKKIAVFGVDLFFILIGSLIYAISINAFIAPNNLAPGGVTGIATMLNYLFGTPVGVVGLLINIPIILWAIVEIGYKMVGKTMIAIMLSSFFIDFGANITPEYHGDPMINALLGGVTQGIGLALIFLRGATTGGTDIIARLLSRRFRHFSMGKMMFAVDGIVVVASAFVFNSIDQAVYACIVIFVCTSLIDMILYGADAGTGKIFFVSSPKTKEMAARILTEMDRGVTFLEARGAYTNEKSDLLFCAVRRFEVYKINSIIREEDKHAFVIVGDAGEISGEGFRPVHADDKTLKEIVSNIGKKKAGHS